MSHGLRVTNNFSNIQIDSTYANHVYAGGGSVNANAGSFTNESSGNTGSFKDLQTINFAGTYDSPPLLFIKINNYSTDNIACSDSCSHGSRHHFCFEAFERNSSDKYTGFTWLASLTSQAHGVKFDYKYFVPIEETTVDTDDDGYGLKVYDADENLVFHSGYPYLCLVDQLEFKGWNNGINGGTSSFANYNHYWDVYFNSTNNNQRTFSGHCGGYYNWVDNDSYAPASLNPELGFHGFKTSSYATVVTDTFPSNTDDTDLWFCVNSLNMILMESGGIFYGAGIGHVYKAVMAKVLIWREGYKLRLSGCMGEFSQVSVYQGGDNPFCGYNGYGISHTNITTVPVAIMRE